MSSSSGRVAALPQLRLYAKALIVVRLDQIHPYGINEGLWLFGFKPSQSVIFELKCAQHDRDSQCKNIGQFGGHTETNWVSDH